MKARLKMLRRIQVARERIRDAAAANLARVDAERRRQESESARAEELRQEIVNESDNRLKIAMHVAEIETLGIEIHAADRCIGEAARALDEAIARTRDAADALRASEREVRLSEKFVLDTRKAMSKANDKHEQATVDDIVASRWSNANE